MDRNKRSSGMAEEQNQRNKNNPQQQQQHQNSRSYIKTKTGQRTIHRTHRKGKHATTRESASRNVEPVDRTGSQ